MPVLRHHGRRLPSTCGSSPRTPERPRRRLLTPSVTLPTQRTGGTIAAVCPKFPYVPRSQTVENIPGRHPDPHRPAASLHVRTRATTSGRQRHSAAGGGNYSASHGTVHRDTDGGRDAASACPDGYARTDGYGDPRADPDDGYTSNCHANATHGYYATHGTTRRPSSCTHADAHLTASPADGYAHRSHNRVAC